MFKSRRVLHVAWMEYMGNVYRIFGGNLKRRDHSEDMHG
jgi:hypothetical protein